MNRKLLSIIGDDQSRGEALMTRLLKSDDEIVRQRKTTTLACSLIIADLVHKGLAYEALQQGANDPVLRILLRTMDELIRRRIDEAVRPLQQRLGQTQLFITTLFLTVMLKLDLPLEGMSQAELDEIHDTCAEQANDMLCAITAQARQAAAEPSAETAVAQS